MQFSGATPVRDAAASARRTAVDFIELFAAEGRIASFRIVRIIVLALLSGVLLVTAWLLLCVAVAALLAHVYALQWEYVILVVAVLQVAAALVLISYVRKTGAHGFFTAILNQIRDRRIPEEAPHPTSLGDLERQRDLCEHALDSSRRAVAKALQQTKAEVRSAITGPAMIAGVVGLGLLAGRRRDRVPRGGFKSSLLGIVLRQLTSLAVAKLVASAMERASRRSPSPRHL